MCNDVREKLDLRGAYVVDYACIAYMDRTAVWWCVVSGECWWCVVSCECWWCVVCGVWWVVSVGSLMCGRWCVVGCGWW